ncbi:MAG TPA: hydrogenase iron-sulfur subunit [Actinobacteria bacterium]|nr:hydrogenase iron-sulfur subunit [Actinomycetota bacterium]
MKTTSPILGPAVDWALRTGTRVRRVLATAERWTLRAERPVERAVGSPRLNPLYHTGTLSVFLFLVVVATGLYVTFFFQYGFEASYEAVRRLEANFVGRIVRGVHRYAAYALVVTSLLHGWRMLVQDRFRGARWPAWVTGVVMMVFLWVAGVSGYWLIWDRRAQALNDLLVETVGGTRVGVDFLIDNLLTPVAETGWPFLLLLFFVHVGLTIGVGVLLYYHVRWLARPLLLPPRYWMVVVGLAIVVVAVVWPLGMLPPFDPTRLPADFPFDPFYLFLLPPGLELGRPSLVWIAFVAVAVVVTALPWVLRRPPLPAIVVHEDRCTGCTLCAVDCPYGALEMVPRDDGEHHQLAVVTPDRCVSCGICIGSCPVEALTLGELPVEPLWEETQRLAATGSSPRLVYICERHALYVGGDRLGEAVRDGDEPVHVIPVICAGMVPPSVVGAAFDAGAGSVQVVGCPPADCANREGNVLEQARLDRTRVPRLNRRYVGRSIATDWVAPPEFDRALDDPGHQPVADPERRPRAWSLLRVVAVVAAASLLSVAAASVPYTPPDASRAMVTIALDHRGGAPIRGLDLPEDLAEGAESRLRVTVDGEVVLDETYPLAEIDGDLRSVAYERIPLEPGTRRIRVELADRKDRDRWFVVFDDTVGLEPGDVLPLVYVDAPSSSSAARGKALFFETTLGQNSGCRVCHSLRPDKVVVGPSLHGVATRAATRVPGMTAEEYLRESIVDPGAYVVEGFPDVMLRNFEEILTEDEIDDLVAFLLTLEE